MNFTFYAFFSIKFFREPDKVKRIQKFECLDFQGKVDLKKFKNRFWIIENYDNVDDLKEGETQTLKKIFFGREIVKRPRGGKKFHGIYELTNRIFLGPTTADNDLAFLMVLSILNNIKHC